MIIKIKTPVNRNGNSYGLIIDTEKKQYMTGCGICSSYDFKAKKSEIDQFVKFTLKIQGYSKGGDDQ